MNEPMEQPAGALIRAPRIRDHELMVPPHNDAGPYEWPTSLDLATDSGRTSMMRCLQRPSMEVDENDGLVIRVRDWLLMPESRVDEETGEERQFLVLAFLTPEGEVVKTSSPVVQQRWRTVLQLWSKDAAWRNLRLSIYIAKTRDGKRRYHELSVMGMED